MHEQLQQPHPVAISAIAGMGGIGKTELALQYAYQHRERQTYPGGICWLRAREDLGLQIVSFARSQLALTLPDDLELVDQVRWCWGKWRAGVALLILDDVQEYADVRPYLPPQDSRFKVLMTTRLKLQSPVQNLEIQVLSEAKALELLRELVRRDRPDLRLLEEIADLETAQQICQWLGYLPLGIELVGRYLARKPDTSLETVWQRLQAKRLDAKALKAAAPEMTASLGVAAAFELSWQELAAPAQQLAALLSLFAPTEIPWELVEACYPEVDAEDLEEWRDEALLTLHLLERTGDGIYQLHPLMREFFAAKREQMPTADAMKQTCCRVLVAEAEHITQKPTRELIQKISPRIPHIIEMAISLTAWLTEEHLITPFTRIAWFYAGQTAYQDSRIWLERCYEISKKRLGASHLAVAASLNNLAGFHFQKGCYPQAEPLLQEALKIFESQLRINHPLVSTIFNNLAEIYRSQGNYSEAELLYRKGLVALEKQLGTTDLRVAASLTNLAELYRIIGRYDEAKPLYRRALAIQMSCLESDHLDVVNSLDGLAALYQEQKDYAEAEPLHLMCLKIRESNLIDDHPDIAASLNNLAELYKAQGYYSRAESFYLEALDILFNFGEEHPNTQTVWQNFCIFIQQVVQAGQLAQLSDHSATQDLLRQMRSE